MTDKPRGALKTASAGLTDVGRQRRHNEDHILVRPEFGLFVVADGMGGHNAGNVASALVTTSIDNFFLATEKEPLPPAPAGEEGLSDAVRRLVTAVRKANRDVFEISSTHQQHHGMGSTIVAIYIPPGGEDVHVAHVGDSRCYRVRDGEIKQLTRDHSLINDALEIKPDLTDAELARLPKNIITRALGMKDQVKVDARTEKMLAGDIYLLCSDGLSGMVNDGDLGDVLGMSEQASDACEVLVAMANDAGGTDNISAVVVRVLEADAIAKVSVRPPRPPSMAPRALAAPEIAVAEAEIDSDVLEGSAAAFELHRLARGGSASKNAPAQAKGADAKSAPAQAKGADAKSAPAQAKGADAKSAPAQAKGTDAKSAPAQAKGTDAKSAPAQAKAAPATGAKATPAASPSAKSAAAASARAEGKPSVSHVRLAEPVQEDEPDDGVAALIADDQDIGALAEMLDDDEGYGAEGEEGEAAVDEPERLTIPFDMPPARCRNCRADLLIGARFCVECGTPMLISA